MDTPDTPLTGPLEERWNNLKTKCLSASSTYPLDAKSPKTKNPNWFILMNGPRYDALLWHSFTEPES